MAANEANHPLQDTSSSSDNETENATGAQTQEEEAVKIEEESKEDTGDAPAQND